MVNESKTCPKCGNELSFFRTCRYLESGEAVCDCRQCGHRICSSADWKVKQIPKKENEQRKKRVEEIIKKWRTK